MISLDYSSQFTGTAYDVLLDIEVNKKTYTEISKKYGFSVPRARQIYNRALIIKKNSYIQYISEHTNLDEETLREICSEKCSFYGHPKYVLAFLEDKFAHLLTPFRDGEPGSPYSIKDYAESLDEPPFHLANYEYEKSDWGKTYRFVPVNETYIIGGIAHCRIELSPLEQSAVKAREEMSMKFKEIGRELRITPEKARKIYEIASIVQLRAKIQNLSEACGVSHHELFKLVGEGSKKQMFERFNKLYEELYMPPNAANIKP